MSQSLTQLYTHIVFHTKTNSPVICVKDSGQLYLYISGIINHTYCKPIAVNGMSDHIHILCTLSKNLSLSKLVQHIKSNSSRWLKSQDVYYQYFEWQAGYGVFSVSSSLLDKTINYIMNQAVHHQKRNFQEEYILFLKEYGVEFDERYLWRCNAVMPSLQDSK